MVAKDEGDTEEEQQEGDQEDQGELLLQVGHPAGLATLVTFYFTHYGDFWGDLPELVIIKVMV